MKLSILTATYNRKLLLDRLYNSILENLTNTQFKIEWLIMDDGSTDNTNEIVNKFVEEMKVDIKYYKQENQGKMAALNNLIPYSTGDLIIECDSDDYFIEGAFNIIYENCKCVAANELYALCFLKYDQNNHNIGGNFTKKLTTMFDLYFKEEENGEKALVFFSEKRKKFKYELEKNEKFITEARMYHKMDLKYKIKCINLPILICEYQENGYTNNINKQFTENPMGYFKYFTEIFEHDTSHMKINKRLYVIKHYILFTYLTNSKHSYSSVKGIKNKILYLLLYIPGTIKSWKNYCKVNKYNSN